MASDSSSASNLFAQCETEPIHIPGAIQPFGMLLTVGAQKLEIQNISENSETAWGLPASDLIGRSFTDFVRIDDIDGIRQYLAGDDPAGQSLRITLTTPANRHGSEWELRAHRYLGCLYFELEPAASGTQPELLHDMVRRIVRSLHSAGTLQDLCDRAAQQVRMATGFDRVMIYRFDESWHGTVVSEARSDQATSYLGHRFPASDIPSQARAVFLQNWLRMIPDVDYVPARIVPDLQPGTDQPLDLGRTLLRSVSPIHLEYLRNMGVHASLTVSLLDDGKLWGLIACHHASPLLASQDQRLAAEMIGRLVSSQLRTKQEQEDRHYVQDLRRARLRLMDALTAETDLTMGLKHHVSGLLDMTAAHPGAVAVCYGNEWACSGDVPPPEALEELVTWLAGSFPDRPIFATNRLSSHFPGAHAYEDIASGLLAMSLTRSARDYVLWFRPEEAATVTWAGAPSKAVRQTGDILSLHPRQSFDSWKEVVTGTAIPWKTVETDAISQLRNDVIAVALQQEYQREQEARQQAERLSREKDEMVMMVSHDLKTPLSVIGMSYEFIKRFHPGKEASVQRMIERGERAMHMMSKLITNILDLAKIEAGTLDLDLKAESAADLGKEAVEVSSALANEKSIRLVAALPPEACKVVCERDRILQVLTNLVSNAVKFTPKGGEIVISAQPHGAEVVFAISDTGEGIAPEHQQNIFERFWQVEEAKFQGSGLGLWISKGIVERHNGKIWVKSEPGVGSTFCFTLSRVDCGTHPVVITH